MSNHKATYQQQSKVSIDRPSIIEIAKDDRLYERDLRVMLMLLSVLDGWKMPEPVAPGPVPKDPLNYKHIDTDAIADTLCLKKKDVKKAVKHIHKLGYIEEGNNDTVNGGYRFTF